MCYQILSRDSVTVSVDAVVYFNVIDAEQALCSVDDFRLDRWAAVGRSICQKSAVGTMLPRDKRVLRLSSFPIMQQC